MIREMDALESLRPRAAAERSERGDVFFVSTNRQKSKEGQVQKISCERCASWQPPARGGTQIPGT